MGRIAMAWLLGLLVGSLWEIPGAGWLGLGAVALGTAATIGLGAHRWRGLLLGAVLLSGAAAASPRRPASPPPRGVARVEGVVERVQRGRAGPSALLRVERGVRIRDGTPIAAGTRLWVRASLPAGSRVRMVARVRPRANYRNPTPHPSWPSRLPDGSATLPPGAKARVLSRSEWREAIEAARGEVRSALGDSLSPRARGLARALVLGEAGAVLPTDREAVRGAGLAHVLAVSGLHVAIVAGLALLAVRSALVRVPILSARFDVTPAALLLAAAVALGFAVLAGGAPSATRAAFTAALTFGLRALGRRPSALSVSATAAVLLGAFAPDDALRPGFWMSILATAAVLGTRPPTDRTLRAWLGAALRLSARTTLATAPVVLWCFDSVPVVGVVANVVLVPVGSVLLVPLAVLHGALATGLPALSFITAAPFEIVGAGFVHACALLSSVVPGNGWPPPSLFQGLVIAAASLVLMHLNSTRMRLAVATVALVLVAGGEVRLRIVEQPTDELRITFLDVGQGDAALVDLPDGRLMVIDAGGTRSDFDDPGRRVLVPLLRARRRGRIDIFVLTHAHPDHYGGLAALVGEMPIGELWDTGQAAAEDPEGALAKLLARARRTGTKIVHPDRLCRRPRHFGGATVEVLAPCPGYDPGWDANDNSLTLRIRMGRRAVVLPGDAEAHLETVLASEAALTADVLKVAHHGSRTSSTLPFLRAVGARVAVVSCGARNRHGHPHAEALGRLRAAGAAILRTDRHGGTELRTDGKQLTLSPILGDDVSL